MSITAVSGLMARFITINVDASGMAVINYGNGHIGNIINVYMRC